MMLKSVKGDSLNICWKQRKKRERKKKKRKEKQETTSTKSGICFAASSAWFSAPTHQKKRLIDYQ